MIKTVFIIFIFVLSCSTSPVSPSDAEEHDDIDDSDVAEVTPDVDKDHVPACVKAWEKAKIIEDVTELFDFEVKTKSGKWNWERKDDREELIFEGNVVTVIGVMKDGSLIVGENYEMEEGYSLLALFHPDGTYTRYLLEFDRSKKFAFGMGEMSQGSLFNYWSGYRFDEKNEEILISVSIGSKVKVPLSEEYFLRPFVITIDSAGNLSYKTWNYKGNSVCTDLFQTDYGIILKCMNWSPDPEIYSVSGKVNAEIVAIYKENVLRKVFPSEFVASVAPFAGYDSGKVYSYYYQDSFSADVVPGFIYSVDEKDLCIEESRPKDFFDPLSFGGDPYVGDDYIWSSGFLKKEDCSFIWGTRRTREESELWSADYSSIYCSHPEKDTLFSFGIKNPFFEVGD